MLKSRLYIFFLTVLFLFVACQSGQIEQILPDDNGSDENEIVEVSDDLNEDQGKEPLETDSEDKQESSIEKEDDTAFEPGISPEPEPEPKPKPEPEPEPEPETCSFDYGQLDLTGINLSANLLAHDEPSGAVWHIRLEKLFMVSDNGYIISMDSDGNDVERWYIGGDLEGIAVADFESDFIYVGVENPDAIKEVNLTTMTVTRTFNLTYWMKGDSNQGLEALTFVPDDTFVEGGRFYAGHQQEGAVYKIELPIKTSSTLTVVLDVDSFIPVIGRSDLSGLDYDRVNGVVYGIYDSSNKIVSFTTDEVLLSDESLPGNNQEGLAIGSECEVFISEDDGEVFRYDVTSP